MSAKEIKTDCLVIGSGIAGLSAALALAEEGRETVVMTAAPKVYESNTWYAQGGIIFRGDSSDPEKLINDILTAGCHVNYRPAVELLARKGPALVEKILVGQAKVPFDRGADSNFHLTREAAHSESRILHRADQSGASIEESLLALLESKSNVRFITKHTAVNLLMSSFHGKDRSTLHGPARCFGAFVFDQANSEVYPIFAKHTVLATGGVGQLYLHNTNSKFVRGDGVALAYRAGCRLENLEYVQFHPTTFFHAQAPRFLVSETLRGEGAVLINHNGDRFTDELAPRDKVARAIHEEMLASGAQCVYLDISKKPSDWIKERFPFIYKNCLAYGVDITVSPIPVVPGAHYHCGGVWTDLDGRTSIANLWAAGEVACTGLHGANRLASTSLLEGLVWGTQAGESISRELANSAESPFPTIDPWEQERVQVDPAFLKQDWLTLKLTMWNYVGLIKSEARLNRAEGILLELQRGIDVFYRKAVLSDELIGLRHACQAALLVLQACRRNRKSLGCYQRADIEI